MLKLLLVSALMITGFAHAGFRGYNSTSDLKLFSAVQCSTGLTCSRGAGDKLVMTSSPTISAGAFSIAGVEAGDAVLTLSADESDDSGDDWLVKSLASSNSLVFYNDTSGAAVAKLTMATTGTISMVGSLVGDGGDSISGFLQNQVAATATTITAAQCGSTFYNSGAVAINLPEASTAIGCRLTFVTLNAANFDVNPDDADTILVLTNANGDMIRNATLGNTVTLQAVSASQWVAVGAQGTWTDAN